MTTESGSSTTPFDAFISYSAEDKRVADAACAVLERHEIRCWIAPRDLLPGMDWGEGIIDAINDSRVMVLVYSASANALPQIKREVERAVHRGMPIIPFRIEDMPMSKSLEYFISSPHWLDAFTPPLEQHLDYLAKTIEVILARPGSDRRPPIPDPIPEPVPVPVPARKKFPLWIAAAVVIAAVAWFALRAGGPVDRSIVGEWTMTNADKAGQRLSTFAITGDGHYRMSVVVHDTGTVFASDGRYQMRSTASTVTQGTYTPLSATTMAITSPLGTVNWTLRPGSAQNGGSPSGIWDADPTMNGAPWHQTITYGPDGAYGLLSTTGDSGTFAAAGGKWTMVSSGGRATEGAYRLTSPRTLSFVGPQGPALWTRP